ncbi:hypothetical protein SH1V18_06620 [Vallitalea longa]|uniref:Uncharacterized protein n=1 Tax=Vallitalea longa TaxID=2936439 RepID=A0A9W5Y7T0_9FIRM|nr:hypothetical protein [Vallitalea longa]GKX28182.1 hypothetical protein SH1V18_06620 [Vallitalea longa]
MRKIRLLVLTVLLTSILSIGVNAQEGPVETNEFKLGNTIYKAVDSDEDDPLAYLSDSITDSDGYVSISSKTYSTMTCDSLKLVVNIQEKVNGSWKTVKTFEFIKYDTSRISKLETYDDINSGSQYRIKTFHHATVDDINYVDINTSSSITVK